jgi:Na+-transporting methylmalonyl-CoA/oxaloacetate decarboxylase gamma subunit
MNEAVTIGMVLKFVAGVGGVMLVLAILVAILSVYAKGMCR